MWLAPGPAVVGSESVGASVLSSDLVDVDKGLAADADALLGVDDRAMQTRVRARLFARAPPQRIGPFEIVRPLGSGGMGDVFVARDPRLERDVALKILRPEVHERLRHRLLREARALAGLDHPNIVRVFDVGTHADKLYMAMELIEGVTVREWVASASPSWVEVVRVFIESARALHAAHAAGLVHRDFKPDNVVVDADGRARVLDFGLALAVGEPSPRPEGEQHQGATPTASIGTRGLVGTVGYMAPEQYLGVAASPSTDQFGWCVSLYESVYRQSPLPKASLREARDATVRGEIVPPPRGAAPSFIARALMRGLAVRPSDRWPSLSVLADWLEARSRYRARGRWIALGGVAATAVAALGLQPAPARACPTTAETVARVFGVQRQQEIARRFGEQGSYGEPLWRQLQPRLETYATSYATRLSVSCRGEPTGTATPELHGACLRERERDLRAVLRVLETADRDAVERAHQAVDGLPTVESCDDPAAYGRRDESAAAERIREELADVRARVQAGAYAAAETPSEALVTAAREHGNVELLVSALLVRGSASLRGGRPAVAERALEEAYFLAYRAGSDGLALEAASALIRVAAKSNENLSAGLVWARHGRALLDPDTPSSARAVLLRDETTLLRELGRLDEAARLGREALRVTEQNSLASRTQIAAAHEALATVLSEAGEYRSAEEHYRTALDTFESALGPRHPATSSTLANTGTLMQRVGRFDEAESLYRRALSSRREYLRSDHPSIVGGLINLGSVLSTQGRFAEAEQAYEEVIEIAEDGPMSEHPHFAWALSNLGTVIARRGEMDAAVELFLRARTIFEQSYGANHSAVAGSWNNIGMVRLSEGAPALAEPAFRNALDIYRESLGEGHPEVARVIGNLAEVDLARLELDSALARAESSLEMRRAALGKEHRDTATSLVLLGRVLIALKRPEAARAALVEAQPILASTLSAQSPERVELDRLLATLPASGLAESGR